jgi:hypothetical protein
VLYTASSAAAGGSFEVGAIAADCLRRVFAFGILAAVGAIGTELKLPAPDLKQL